MFDKRRRTEFVQASVSEVIAVLSKLPASCEVCFNGSEWGFLHVNTEGTICSFDDDALEEDYPEDEEDDSEPWFGDCDMEESWAYEERNYQRLYHSED